MIERSQKMRVSRIEPADSQPKSPGGAAVEATWRGTRPVSLPEIAYNRRRILASCVSRVKRTTSPAAPQRANDGEKALGGKS